MGGAIRSEKIAIHDSEVMMSEQEVPVTVAKRIIILSQEDVKPAESLRKLTNKFRNETLSRSGVFAWHMHVENESHDRRPRTSITDNKIHRVQQFFDGDRRLILIKIAKRSG